jgi:hypothetical protein
MKVTEWNDDGCRAVEVRVKGGRVVFSQYLPDDPSDHAARVRKQERRRSFEAGYRAALAAARAGETKDGPETLVEAQERARQWEQAARTLGADLDQARAALATEDT